MKKSSSKPCYICKSDFTPRFTSFQNHCNEPECVTEHLLRVNKKEKEKAEKERKSKWAKEKKERLDKLLTHGEWEKKLESDIREIIRLIDAGTNCLACSAKIYGKYQGDTSGDNDAQASHRWSVGGYNNLRYDLRQIFLCGVCCNKHNGGNLDKLDEGILRVYGEEEWRYIREEVRAKYPIVKLSIPEIKEKIVIAKQIVKELKTVNMLYPPKVRTELRIGYNTRIGIYL